MTPDELPADMEGRVKADLDEAMKGKKQIVVAYASNLRTLLNNLELARQAIKNHDDGYAALLKAYQEQRRALERIVNAADAGITKRHIRDYAAEALNQKGDER
jgi:outer membrane protein TolC